jgi:hypothetical protein
VKVICRKFLPLERNTLRGFAEISILDWNLTIRDVAIHSKNASTWAQPPSKPQIRDGAVVKDHAGKIQYTAIFDFASREARNQFSAAVVDAVLASDDGVALARSLRAEKTT